MEVQHNVSKNQEYIRRLKKICKPDFDKVTSAVENLLLTFNFCKTTRSDMVYRSPVNGVEIWELRIADPNSNRGSSGGFRLLVVYNKKDNAVFMDYIESRVKMNKPKVKYKYNCYLATLKSEVDKL
jgi:mRNA-degrading endonuclease RelE of RelBE toxin-antitoxin system